MKRADARVLLIGVGGLGCPAALAVAHSGVGVLGLCDDDVVERTNLPRQILFGDADVGSTKIDAAARALRVVSSALDVRLHRSRLLPEKACHIT